MTGTPVLLWRILNALVLSKAKLAGSGSSPGQRYMIISALSI